MLPLFLSIEGLYSYQTKQEIDFTYLTEAGLFGIFGNVGSGKSSILEAIGFALYGETERLNKAEKRAYNMLNLKSQTATIIFDFLNFEGRKFRFTVQWKRKKKFEETGSIERLAYEWVDAAWIPLESADGELVTNLSYPNFRRTIIIPQGQFKEFLELKGKERSDMMKDIFHLNQYDLGPKVSLLQADNNKKIENVKGALSSYDDINQENITLVEAEFNQTLQSLQLVKEEHTTLDIIFKKLSQAHENAKNLALKERELEQLMLQKDVIAQLEQELREYELLTREFKEPINNLHNYTASKENLLLKIEKLKEVKVGLQDKILVQEQEYTLAKREYNDIENWRNEADDFRILAVNADSASQIKERLSRIDKGTPLLIEITAKEQELTTKLKATEDEVDQLKTESINTSVILALENWYQQKDLLSKKSNEIQQQIDEQNNAIASYKQAFIVAQLDEHEWQIQLQQRTFLLQEALDNLSEQESQYRVKKELSQFVLSLHTGKPCPLCGAIEHPTPMHAEDLAPLETKLTEERIRLKDEENSHQQTWQELTKVATILQEKKENILRLVQELEAVTNTMSSHDSTFIWTDFDRTNRSAFEARKNAIQLHEKNIRDKENIIKNLREELHIAHDKAVKYQKSLDDLAHQVQIFEANIIQNTKQLKTLLPDAFTALSTEELTEKSRSLLAQIKDTEHRYQDLTNSLNADKNAFASIIGQYTESHEQYLQASNLLQHVQQQINTLLKEHHYTDIIAVKKILEKQLDIELSRTKIQQYHIEVSTIKNRIEELSVICQQDQFSEETYRECQEQLQLKKTELEEQLTRYGALEKELQRLKHEIEKKTVLLHDFEQLNHRKENLNTLFHLFKGNGFVNYVSSIHLERLCHIANQRFHRLTKNQLSLTTNENNEFEVIDFLNNGNKRSVKTLSGGQGFQASLCLALALAESIQSLNKADRNFFFIDEGFGTLDSESMNTVFDTLQYLHQENRIVGIISHVQDLKERMPRAITVFKNPDTGSEVQYSH